MDILGGWIGSASYFLHTTQKKLFSIGSTQNKTTKTTTHTTHTYLFIKTINNEIRNTCKSWNY